MGKGTLSEDSYVSSFAFVDEVKQQIKVPEKVRVRDCTLREGFNSGLITCGIEQKKAIAKMLDKLGVSDIEIELISLDKNEVETLRSIVEEVQRAKTSIGFSAFAPDFEKLVDTTLDCGVDYVEFFTPTSQNTLRYMQLSEKQVIDKVVNCIRYCKSVGIPVSFGTTDTPRSKFEFLKELYEAALKVGADKLGIADTWGTASPPAIRYLVRKVKEVAGDITVGIHCHNDFGLSMANTLAGLEEGANMADVSICGLGERSGITSLSELVITLTILYDIDLGIEIGLLKKTSELLEKLANFSIPPNKPVVGDLAFSHIFDRRAKSLCDDPLLIHPFKPALVGNESKLLISEYAGPLIVKEKLKKLGIEVAENTLLKIVSAVREATLAKKPYLTDSEVLEIVRSIK